MKINLFFLLSIPIFAFAQQFDARSNRYSENSSHVNARDMMVTLDKGFVVVGNSEMFSGQIATGGFVFYSDSSGNNHWEKVYTSFGDFFSFETVLQLTDSSFIAGGKMFNPITNRHGAALLKLDKLGNEIWKKSIDDSTDDETSILDIQQINDSTLIVLGTKGGSVDGSFIIQLDTAGNIQWQKSMAIEGSPVLILNSLNRLSDSTFILSGGVKIGEQTTVGLLLKIDLSGNALWSKQGTQENSFYTDVISDENTIYCRNVSGSNVNGVSAFDYSGNVLWNYNLQETEIMGPITPSRRKLRFDTDSNLVFYFANLSFSIFHRISRQGIFIDEFAGLGMAQGIDFTSDNQCLVLLTGPAIGIKSSSIYNNNFAVTRLNDFSTGQSSCLWDYTSNQSISNEPTEPIVLTTDSSYLIHEAMMENVSAFMMIEHFCVYYLSGLEEADNSFSMFPNPATELVTIQLNSDVVNDDSIILYNAFGNQIRQVRTTNKKIIINLAEFSSGIYWLKIGERVEKLIIE